MKHIEWQLKHPFEGLPKLSDFQLIEEELPDLEDGQITIEALYLSPDPYQKLLSGALKTPCTMMGSVVARIIQSKNEKFPTGSMVVSNHGWILRGNIDPTTKSSLQILKSFMIMVFNNKN